MKRGAVRVVCGICAWVSCGCNLIGPSCIDRTQRGTVTTILGEVAAAETTSHRVRYATEGSQNDARISWQGQFDPDGPRLRFYATRIGCVEFNPGMAAGECAVLGAGGAFDGGVATTLVVANGRGNPDVLGVPAEYKLWVVGDPLRSAGYTIHITWFYGPDC